MGSIQIKGYPATKKAIQLPPVIKIKAIECITPLDNGSDNKGSGIASMGSNGGTLVGSKGGILKGFIYGKTYKFKVKTYYKNATPKQSTTNKIVWEYEYTDDSGNVVTNTPQQTSGDTAEIEINNYDLLGKGITVYAYLSNKSTEGKLTEFCHYRFRFFDKKVFEKELNDRKTKPFLISQGSTSLCGLASLFYLLAKDNYKQFADFSMELFIKGKAKINNYLVEPAEEIINKDPDKSDFPYYRDTINKICKLPYVDYITMASVRNTDNKSYKGGNEQFQAINWSWMMTELLDKMNGYGDIQSSGIYNPIKKTYYSTNSSALIYNEVKELNKAYKQGYRIILMIDSDLISPDPDTLGNLFAFEYHWVVLTSSIQKTDYLDGDGKIFYKYKFDVFTWGSEKKYLKSKITIEHFAKNYYGYIKVK